MNYELAKELKEAGFPQGDPFVSKGEYTSSTGMRGRLGLELDEYKAKHPDCLIFYCPTLEELIEACGDTFGTLEKTSIGIYGAYKKNDMMTNGVAATPTEAVARLWLALNKKTI
jgi:hypothetical protein